MPGTSPDKLCLKTIGGHPVADFCNATLDIRSTGQKNHRTKGSCDKGAPDKRTTVVGRKVQSAMRHARRPVADVPAWMQVLRGATPAVDGMTDWPWRLLWRHLAYVTSTGRRIKSPQASSTASTSDDGANQLAIRLRRIPAPFPPQMWNVHDATLQDNARTNNDCEGWNNVYRQLIGYIIYNVRSNNHVEVRFNSF